MRSLFIVVGTRPNFIKVTQFRKVAENFDGIEIKIIHTGQHYDDKMARVFFDQFGLRPDLFLDVQPNYPGLQIAESIAKLTNLLLEERPDMLMVVGDVNSTVAAAIAANKCDIPIAHLESGLRSNDSSMPEEYNRLIADSLATLHFVTEDSGIQNLRRENKRDQGIEFVGNTMIDTLISYQEQIAKSAIQESLGVKDGSFALVTIHRPSNVDSEQSLSLVIEVLSTISSKTQVVFPVHPRTSKKMKEFGLATRLQSIPNLIVSGPLSYFDFQRLVAGGSFVLTDSGGIQEETTYLQKPCLTLRLNTERPITVEVGSNELLPFEIDQISKSVDSILAGKGKMGKIPEFWDGNATFRVLKRIESFFNQGF